MATKKSTLAFRSRRNPVRSRVASEALYELIEDERRRLMDAEAVLDCLVKALEEDERLNASGPCYSTVILVVYRFVRASIDQLDSLNIKAALARARISEAVLDERNSAAATRGVCNHGGVKEPLPLYVH